MIADVSIAENLDFIYPPEPVHWGRVVLLSLGALLALSAAGYGIWRWWQEYQRVRRLTRPQREAWAALHKAWENLRSETYLEYLFEATRIIKEYMGGRFGLHTPNQTVSELEKSIQGVREIPEEWANHILSFFRHSDRIKFGSCPTNQEELYKLHKIARGFIDITAWTKEKERMEKKKGKGKA